MEQSDRNKKILKLLEETTAKISVSRDVAYDYLCGGPIYTKKGKLRKIYRDK